MAYYNNYPILNQSYPYMQYQQPIQQVQQPIQQQPVVQQGGYINVSSEQEAINYPIAPNTSLIFIDWANKKVYEKIKGLSPSDVPMMKKYNLIDITEGKKQPEQLQQTNSIEYAQKSEIERIDSEMKHIKKQLESLAPETIEKENENA